VEIGYLRKRFADSGKLIQVLLIVCTRFAFKEYEKNDLLTALAVIAGLRPEIVTASMKDGFCYVDCTTGTLEVVAESGVIRLDNGREVTLQDLLGVAQGYWREWREHWEKVRQGKNQ
jgi:hypothetical protein